MHNYKAPHFSLSVFPTCSCMDFSKIFLSDRIYVHSQAVMEESDVLTAVRTRNVPHIYELGESGFDFNELHLDKEMQSAVTPLHLAVRLGHAEVVDALLDLEVSTIVPSSDGFLPVDGLAFDIEDADKICQSLITHEPSGGYDRKILFKLLLRAIQQLRPESVSLLLDNGAPALETSRLIGHYRSYITTPLCMWAGMELGQTLFKLDQHAQIGAILLKKHAPRTPVLHRALLRAICVGNKAAAKAIIDCGVNLTVDANVSIFERDALVTAIEGHYSVQRRDEFIPLVLNSGYWIAEEMQDVWIRNVLPSVLIARGMTCKTARLIFSVLGKLCRGREIWNNAIHQVKLEEEETAVHPGILNGLTYLQEMDQLNLCNLTRDAIRCNLISNTPETILTLTTGLPVVIRRFLLLEDIFPDK